MKLEIDILDEIYEKLKREYFGENEISKTVVNEVIISVIKGETHKGGKPK